MNRDEVIYHIALTRIPGIGPIWSRNLLKVTGSASDIFLRRRELPKLMKGVTPRIVEALDCPDIIAGAAREYEFAEKNNIRCLTINDEAYPSRMRECDDAPILLYYKGNTDLNNLRVLNMVGTRNATEYGKQLCSQFLKDLKETCPNVLVVSGLAYGIDIHAHRAALDYQLPTVAVLAHGLDRIYPQVHRKTAIDMLSNGGLLTEFPSGTTPDRFNFVSRNRIVAGISDATIVVQSAAKGGSLITADIANSYNRECFAFPGRTNDDFSKGCNRLIRDNKACLIESAMDFVKSMQWDEASAPKPKAIQRSFFPDLTEDEMKVVRILEAHGDMQINLIVVEADIPVYKMNTILFELEMKGLVRVMAGGVYKLV